MQRLLILFFINERFWGFNFLIILHSSIIQNFSFNMQVEFNPELLSEQSICPLTNFKHLRFLYIESLQIHRDLIDSMLWTIHPEMISVKLCSLKDSAFIKVKYFIMSDCILFAIYNKPLRFFMHYSCYSRT